MVNPLPIPVGITGNFAGRYYGSVANGVPGATSNFPIPGTLGNDQGKLTFYNYVGTVNADAGNDTLTVKNWNQSSAARIYMGAGNDTVIYSMAGSRNANLNPSRRMVLNGGNGYDTLSLPGTQSTWTRTPSTFNGKIFQNKVTKEQFVVYNFENIRYVG